MISFSVSRRRARSRHIVGRMRKSARRTFGVRLSVCHAYENAARLDRCSPFQFQAPSRSRDAKNRHSSDWRKSETEKPQARFSRERDRQIREGGFEETREGSGLGCVNDKTTVQRRATKGPHGISRMGAERVESWFGRVPRGARVSAVPAGDASGDDRPLVAVHGMRGEDFLVLLFGERPALHRGVELVAPPACVPKE